MLIRLTEDQLDSFAAIGPSGVITADTAQLARILGEAMDTEPPRVALTLVDYSQHPDGTPEPNTRTVKGIAWSPLGDNRCRQWSFSSDGLALSTTDEGESPCPISEDPGLIDRALTAVASGHPGATVDESTRLITISLSNGGTKQVRVAVIHDPRVVRPEDILEAAELAAYRSGALGVVIIQPTESGPALVRKIGLD